MVLQVSAGPLGGTSVAAAVSAPATARTASPLSSSRGHTPSPSGQSSAASAGSGRASSLGPDGREVVVGKAGPSTVVPHATEVVSSAQAKQECNLTVSDSELGTKASGVGEVASNDLDSRGIDYLGGSEGGTSSRGMHRDGVPGATVSRGAHVPSPTVGSVPSSVAGIVPVVGVSSVSSLPSIPIGTSSTSLARKDGLMGVQGFHYSDLETKQLQQTLDHERRSYQEHSKQQ